MNQNWKDIKNNTSKQKFEKILIKICDNPIISGLLLYDKSHNYITPDSVIQIDSCDELYWIRKKYENNIKILVEKFWIACDKLISEDIKNNMFLNYWIVEFSLKLD